MKNYSQIFLKEVQKEFPSPYAQLNLIIAALAIGLIIYALTLPKAIVTTNNGNFPVDEATLIKDIRIGALTQN